MDIVTPDVEAEWVSILREHAAEANAEEIADTIASDPRLACGMSPQNEDDIDEILAIVDELFDRFVRPEFGEDTDLRPVHDEFMNVLEDDLQQTVTTQTRRRKQWEAQRQPPFESTLNQPLDSGEISDLLRARDPMVRYKAAHVIAEHVESHLQVADETVEPLLANLSDSETMVQRAAARGLADVSKHTPNSVAPYVDHVVERLDHEIPLIRLELITTLVNVSEVVFEIGVCDPEVVVTELASTMEDGSYDEIRAMAAKGLKLIAESNPEAVADVGNELWFVYRHDPYQPSRLHAYEALSTLEEASIFQFEEELERPVPPNEEDENPPDALSVTDGGVTRVNGISAEFGAEARDRVLRGENSLSPKTGAKARDQVLREQQSHSPETGAKAPDRVLRESHANAPEPRAETSDRVLQAKGDSLTQKISAKINKKASQVSFQIDSCDYGLADLYPFDRL